MKAYHNNIFYSEDDGGYSADIPDLDACSAFRETPAEALRVVELARQAWLEAVESPGRILPEPIYRPVNYQVVPL